MRAKKPERGTLGEKGLDRSLVQHVRTKLLAWYGEHRRDLPWRSAATPYHVWISEVMLQQTRVEVVKDYFVRWLKLFPTVDDLARADETDVLHAWQGLGYYSRAKRLRTGAMFVRDRYGGSLPAEADELLSIPGIGPYSAGAISSIAFGRRAPLVDGNVIRVLTRFFALPGDPNKAPLKKYLWSVAAQLVPEDRPGDFNQALMELGATVCTPRKPACYACPLAKKCTAFSEGKSQAYPELAQRPPPEPLTMVMLIAEHRGALAVESLGPDAPWWAGLDACPFAHVTGAEQPIEVARRLAERLGTPKDVTVLSPLTHTVTRFKTTLFPVRVRLSDRNTGGRVRWVTRGNIGLLALPAPHRKILKQYLGA